MPASEYRSLQSQVRELQRLLARRRWRPILKALESPRAQKSTCCALERGPDQAPIAKPLGRPPQPDADLVAEIKAVIGETPTYSYRRVWLSAARGLAQRLPPPNHNASIGSEGPRLLLNRHAGGSDKRRHKVASPLTVPTALGSDSFELPCDNARGPGRIALDCATARPWVLSPPPRGSKARTCAISGHSGGLSLRTGQPVPETIEWLTDNAPVHRA